MAEVMMRAVPFDSNEILDPDTGQLTYDRVAYSRDYADWWRTYFSNGILVKGGQIMSTELQVVAGEGLNSIVKMGSIIINGRTGWLEKDTELTHSIGVSQPRIDRVIAELNIPNDREIKIRILEGEPAESPIPPEIIKTEDVYQMALAQVRVAANSAIIESITDERDNAVVCGISQVLIGVKPPLRPTGDSADNIKVTDETALLYEHENTDTDTLTTDKALAELSYVRGTASYIAFVGNVNTNSLDAAFGKNNENSIQGIGRALAMYAVFKNPEVTTDFSELIKCKTFSDITNSIQASELVIYNEDILSLIKLSPYALSLWEGSEGKLLAYLYGLDTTEYSSLESFFTNEKALVAIATCSDEWNKFMSERYLTGNSTVRNWIYNTLGTATLFTVTDGSIRTLNGTENSIFIPVSAASNSAGFTLTLTSTYGGTHSWTPGNGTKAINNLVLLDSVTLTRTNNSTTQTVINYRQGIVKAV